MLWIFWWIAQTCDQGISVTYHAAQFWRNWLNLHFFRFWVLIESELSLEALVYHGKLDFKAGYYRIKLDNPAQLKCACYKEWTKAAIEGDHRWIHSKHQKSIQSRMLAFQDWWQIGWQPILSCVPAAHCPGPAPTHWCEQNQGNTVAQSRHNGNKYAKYAIENKYAKWSFTLKHVGRKAFSRQNRLSKMPKSLGDLMGWVHSWPLKKLAKSRHSWITS